MTDALLSDEELERYARHIVLRDIGGAGQVRLKRARVLVIGAGGLGSPALLYLAAAGVGNLAVADDDAVSLSNLQRQVLHESGSVGRPKVESAEETLGRLNPEIQITTHLVRVDSANARDLVRDHDVVLDGSDSFSTRRIVNRACTESRVPLVSGAISTWDGSISVFRPWLGTPCWRCLYPEPSSETLTRTCAETGVLGSLAGVVGAMMATECVKLVTGAGTLLENRLLLYDALDAEFRILKAEQQADCPVCSRIR